MGFQPRLLGLLRLLERVISEGGARGTDRNLRLALRLLLEGRGFPLLFLNFVALLSPHGDYLLLLRLGECRLRLGEFRFGPRHLLLRNPVIFNVLCHESVALGNTTLLLDLLLPKIFVLLTLLEAVVKRSASRLQRSRRLFVGFLPYVHVIPLGQRGLLRPFLEHKLSRCHLVLVLNQHLPQRGSFFLVLRLGCYLRCLLSRLLVHLPRHQLVRLLLRPLHDLDLAVGQASEVLGVLSIESLLCHPIFLEGLLLRRDCLLARSFKFFSRDLALGL
mmetsp:Transcript_1432/g.3056  ORF Transcript_1432/g.3056 Transcript_1432/m.3056 type:complete len:275 (+) Transcript_1432:661-1485(+)